MVSKQQEEEVKEKNSLLRKQLAVALRSVQTEHHSILNINLVLDREVDEISIHQNSVRRNHVSVVRKEHP